MPSSVSSVAARLPGTRISFNCTSAAQAAHTTSHTTSASTRVRKPRTLEFALVSADLTTSVKVLLRLTTVASPALVAAVAEACEAVEGEARPVVGSQCDVWAQDDDGRTPTRRWRLRISFVWAVFDILSARDV